MPFTGLPTRFTSSPPPKTESCWCGTLWRPTRLTLFLFVHPGWWLARTPHPTTSLLAVVSTTSVLSITYKAPNFQFAFAVSWTRTLDTSLAVVSSTTSKSLPALEIWPVFCGTLKLVLRSESLLNMTEMWWGKFCEPTVLTTPASPSLLILSLSSLVLATVLPSCGISEAERLLNLSLDTKATLTLFASSLTVTLLPPVPTTPPLDCSIFVLAENCKFTHKTPSTAESPPLPFLFLVAIFSLVMMTTPAKDGIPSRAFVFILWTATTTGFLALV